MAVLKYKAENKAFSLLELIIAVAVLSIGIVAVLEALSFTARLAGLSSDIVNAVLFSEDKMQELEFKESQRLLESEPQEAMGEKGKFKWEYMNNLDADLGLYKLDFNIKWQRRDREEKINLNTYLLK
jgi:prepilin-type N-terminal cleavage/methylation domain-containing protein